MGNGKALRPNVINYRGIFDVSRICAALTAKHSRYSLPYAHPNFKPTPPQELIL